MPDILHSLLDDPILSISTKTSTTPTWCTLPEAFALITQDELVTWLGLQPHQQQPWHCFLAQLGALAYTKLGWSQWPRDAKSWHDALLTLTNHSPEAWALIVEEPTKPAFMQPPIPEGSLEEAGYLKNTLLTPDDLDLLVTAKNFDIKIQRASLARPEQWAYALVSLQTLEGFLGQGNYGIARMNGGFGSRPMVGLTPSIEPARWLRRDMEVLRQSLNARQEALGPHALIWIEPWDGEKESSIPISQCHPYFIEICRRLRLIHHPTQDIICHRTTTKASRIEVPKESTGHTQDPWAPILAGKLLTLSARGFHYKLVAELLDHLEMPCMRYHPSTDSPAPLLVCTCLVRGQGKTEGFHQRVIPIRAAVIPKLFGRKPDAPSPVHALSNLQIELAKNCSNKALRPALLTLAHGGESLPSKNTPELVTRGQDYFEQLVDAHFFTALWDGLEHGQEAHRIFWQEKLVGWAKQSLEHSIHNSPLPSMRSYKAIANATSMLHGCLRKQCPDYYASLTPPHTQEQSA